MGRAQGWGSGEFAEVAPAVPHRATPTPNPSPQGGGEQTARVAETSCSSSRRSQPQFLGAVEADRGVGRRQDEAAAGAMGAHQVGQDRLRGGVERGGRLVEQPDRSGDRDHAREREPPALAGREIAGRQMRQPVEAD